MYTLVIICFTLFFLLAASNQVECDSKPMRLLNAAMLAVRSKKVNMDGETIVKIRTDFLGNDKLFNKIKLHVPNNANKEPKAIRELTEAGNLIVRHESIIRGKLHKYQFEVIKQENEQDQPKMKLISAKYRTGTIDVNKLLKKGKSTYQSLEIPEEFKDKVFKVNEFLPHKQPTLPVKKKELLENKWVKGSITMVALAAILGLGELLTKEDSTVIVDDTANTNNATTIAK